MDIRMIPEQEAERWEAFVHHNPCTVAWQSYHWHKVLDGHYAFEFLPLAAVDGDRITGVLPLYRQRGNGTGGRLLSVPFAVAGGMTAETPEAARLLFDAAAELCQQKQATGITFKQYRYPLDQRLRTDTNYFNRELDLTPGPERLWAQFDLRNRRAIEGAPQEMLTLDYPSTRVDLFYDLLLNDQTRLGIPCPSRQWIHSLVAFGMYDIALLEHQGRPLAATMTKRFRKTVSFPFSCRRDHGPLALQACYVLYWRLIQHFSGIGHEIFHSGRMPGSEDVVVYRLGWGGEKHPYFYQYYPEADGGTEFGRKRGLKRRIFTSCWKRMPSRLAGVLGPRIVEKYP